MTGIIILIFIVIIFIAYILSSCKELKELKQMRNSCLDNLCRALELRYNVMQDMIDFSKGYVEDENRFVAKLLQIKLVSPIERVALDADVVKDLKNLIFEIGNVPALCDSQKFKDLRCQLAKAEKAIFEAKNSLNERSNEFNELINRFPKNIASRICGFKKVSTYEIKFISR